MPSVIVSSRPLIGRILFWSNMFSVQSIAFSRELYVLYPSVKVELGPRNVHFSAWMWWNWITYVEHCSIIFISLFLSRMLDTAVVARPRSEIREVLKASSISKLEKTQCAIWNYWLAMTYSGRVFSWIHYACISRITVVCISIPIIGFYEINCPKFVSKVLSWNSPALV